MTEVTELVSNMRLGLCFSIAWWIILVTGSRTGEMLNPESNTCLESLQQPMELLVHLAMVF